MLVVFEQSDDTTVNFSQANLTSASFRGATIDYADFSTARGLNTADFTGTRGHIRNLHYQGYAGSVKCPRGFQLRT